MIRELLREWLGIEDIADRTVTLKASMVGIERDIVALYGRINSIEIRAQDTHDKINTLVGRMVNASDAAIRLRTTRKRRKK